MGRSRRRQTAATRLQRPAAAPQELQPPRRLLAAYLAGALFLAVVVLAGTVALAGILAPWVVLAVVASGAATLHRTVGARLAATTLSDDDRVLQGLAGGLLILVVLFALVAAVVLTATH